MFCYWKKKGMKLLKNKKIEKENNFVICMCVFTLLGFTIVSFFLINLGTESWRRVICLFGWLIVLVLQINYRNKFICMGNWTCSLAPTPNRWEFRSLFQLIGATKSGQVRSAQLSWILITDSKVNLTFWWSPE